MANDGEANQRYTGISAVDRAIRMLEMMVGSSDGLTVSELSDGLEIHKSIVSRILASLEATGYVSCDRSSRRYSLTFKFIGLAYRHTDSLGFPDFCQPVLHRLRDETGELAQLAVVGEEGAVLYARAESKHQLRVTSYLGRILPLHSSAACKVWLASQPEEKAIQLVVRAGLASFTPKTITTVDAFRDELRKVRQQGFATNLEERVLGVNVVGVPICSRTTGIVVGAVLLSGPASRFTLSRMQETVPLLREAAEELSLVWPLTDHLPIREELADIVASA